MKQWGGWCGPSDQIEHVFAEPAFLLSRGRRADVLVQSVSLASTQSCQLSGEKKKSWKKSQVSRGAAEVS